MGKLGEWLDYTGDTCPNCGRVRIVATSSGKRVCEKCSWCIEDGEYYREDLEDDYCDHFDFGGSK